MATDYRPQARAVLQDPTSAGYKRLESMGLMTLSRGASIAALTQPEAQRIINTRDIGQDIIARLSSLLDGSTTKTTRRTSPRKSSIEIPDDHSQRVFIRATSTRYSRGEWRAAIDTLKLFGALYGGKDRQNAWYLTPDQWDSLRASTNQMVLTRYTTDPSQAINSDTDHTGITDRVETHHAETRTSPSIASDSLRSASSDCQTTTENTQPQPTTTTERTTAPMSTNVFTNLQFDSHLAGLQTRPSAEAVERILHGIPIQDSSENITDIAGQIARYIGGSVNPMAGESLPDAITRFHSAMSASLTARVPAPGDTPNLRDYLTNATKYTTHADPSGIMGARAKFSEDMSAYNANTEAWVTATARVERLCAVSLTMARDTAQEAIKKQEEAQRRKAEQEAEEERRKAHAGMQTRLDAIRAHVKTLPVPRDGVRPSLDKKYNTPPSFQRLFIAMGYQLAATGRTENILFTGPKGTGKTKAASVYAASLGLDLFVLNCQTARDTREVFAEKNADEGRTFYSETAFTEIVKRGHAVILLDEITRAAPAVQNAFLSLLDGQGRVHIAGYGDVTCGENLVWIASANEGSSYSGTARLDLALDDRFSIRWEMGHLSPDAAANALMAHLGLPTTTTHTPPTMAQIDSFAPHGIDHATAFKFAQVIQAIQTAYNANTATARLTHDEGQRTLEGMGRLYALLGAESLEYSLLSKYKQGEERNAVKKIVADAMR